jgi:pimeloyl-ACP methyl ester carboxylesterase
MPKSKRNPADYIVPLSINGLEGRMLHIPAGEEVPEKHKKREIMFIYGHHSTLERWWGLTEVLAGFGNVTMPDLPGFGGMDSFYKIGRKPTIDNLADYLATFIKWRYRRKKVVIIGMSFGFVIATRMLQRYPELTQKVELLISLVGFAHYQDFLFSRTNITLFRMCSSLMAQRPVAWTIRHVFLTAPMLKLFYANTYGGKRKFAQIEAEDFDKMMNIEIHLWQTNDVKTHWFTSSEFFRLNNCNAHVDLPVWHVGTAHDHFFNNTVVEQHFRVIFTDFHGTVIDLPTHAPSVIADAEMAEPFMPEELRQALRPLP